MPRYIYRGHEYLANNNKTRSKEASFELEMEITRREPQSAFISEIPYWAVQQQKQQAPYAARWTTMYSPFVQRNIGSIEDPYRSL